MFLYVKLAIIWTLKVSAATDGDDASYGLVF